MKLQNLTVIFIIIILPIILLVSLYINTGLRTIRYQALYDTGLITATQDAIKAFEINTLKNNYSNNPEMKRSIIKSSIKMFETSLCDTCNISLYNADEIEEYIPAVVFGMSDGFYMYAPSYNPKTGRYEHSLKNYVYYSEMLNKENAIVIRYSLDSYVHISGYFDDKYESKEGYLINTEATEFKNKDGNKISAQDFYDDYQAALGDGDDATKPLGTITYYGTSIDIADELAVNYFVDNYKFSDWFETTVIPNINTGITGHPYLIIGGYNDPEDPNSAFVKHKNEVIKEKIEGVLNSSITAYSERTWGQNYKMPKLSEEDWERIYSDISVTTFFQGKKIGLTKYNGYCVLNSNNHYELINPNLLYFSTDDDNSKSIDTNKDYYHDIRCEEITNTTSIEVTQNLGRNSIKTIRGWRIGRFQKKTKDDGSYNYERAECACYECINGSISNGTSLYDYIKVAGSNLSSVSDFIKESYWTSLARERGKLHEDRTIPSDFTIKKYTQDPSTGEYIEDRPITVINGNEVNYKIVVENKADKREEITVTDNVHYITSDIIQIDEIKINLKKTDGTINTLNSTGVDLNLGYKEELGKGEILEIYYTARIKDNDGNNQVTNIAVADNNLGKSVSSEETCNTVNSNILLEKTIIENKKKVLYGKEELTYQITIKNDSSITDNIDIKDAYYNEEINIIGITSDSAKIETNPGTDYNKVLDAYNNEVGNRSKNWKNIDIGPGEEINIYIKATLKGGIGKEVVNTVMVKSNLTFEETWASASAGCFVEKEVKVAVNTVNKKRIFLALDKSNSMDDYIYERVSAFDRGVGRGSYPREVREFINRVHSETTSQITGAVLFAGDATTKVHETSELNKYNIWETDLGTRYNTALKKANERLNNGDILIFFSDGNPTDSLNVIEYPYKEEGNVAIGKDVWDSIREQLGYIKSKGVTVYAVGYDTKGETDLKGLEKVIASDENKYISGNNIDTLFNTLFNKIFSSLSLPPSYASDNGKIEIEYVNRIKDIKVDGVSLSGFDSYIIDKNETNPDNVTGTLDLTRIINLTGDEEITIFYE